MEKIKEELLEKLREMRDKAQEDLKQRAGYENYEVKNVIRYNKKVELVNKETGETEVFELCVVIAEDPKTGEVIELYYLNGEEADFSDLLRKYESALPIKDVIDATKENEEKPEEEKDPELSKEELEELEAEKAEEEQELQKNEEDKKRIEQESSIEDERIDGQKLKYAIQTVDVDKAYIDNRTTVRRGFNIPADVQEIAVAKPMQADENVLSEDMTMYMLDKNGRIIEETEEGKTITDLFETDDATGKRPTNDENTKLELDGTAERNKSHTMRRFTSKENPNLHLSVERGKIDEYSQLYAGRKTMDGNDAVEVQLETRNVPIQTSREMQKIASGYKGIYNIEDIDHEVDEHEAHGDDMDEIQIENADGKENTAQICDGPYIPGTEMTWEELSDETGEGIRVLQERFGRELEKGKAPEDVLSEIQYDYGMVEHTRDRM